MADLSLLIGTIQQQMGTRGNEGMRVRGQGVIFFFFFILFSLRNKEMEGSEWVEEEKK